jgi:hypothetical protein
LSEERAICFLNLSEKRRRIIEEYETGEEGGV